MFRKPQRLAVALVATAAACLLVATTADAAVHRRILRVSMKKPVLFPAHVKMGYVGAAGYPYGPPGPIQPTLVDFPPSGFFTPGGFIGTPGKFLTAGLADAPTLVPGVIGIGTGITTDVIGAGTGIIGAGTGVIIAPLR